MRSGIQGYGIVLLGQLLPTFQTKLVPSSSGVHSWLDLLPPEEPTLTASVITLHTRSP
jgi:hypothetical protein